MADERAFKLFTSVDPTKINVPIKEKFAKLTLSSNKKKQQQQQEQRSKPNKETTPVIGNVSRNLLDELTVASESAAKPFEHPLLRSDSSSSGPDAMILQVMSEQDADQSDYMAPLQLSAEDALSQQSKRSEIDALSQQVSNLTMATQPAQAQPLNEISICISSATEEANDDDDDDETVSCITISDSSISSNEQQQQAEQSSMAVSEQPPQPREQEQPPLLTTDKVQRIEAFLRDVSFERRQMALQADGDNLHTKLANADTESMSITTDALDDWQCPLPGRSESERPIVPERRDSSKRLADDDTEVNTLCTDELDATLDETPPAEAAAVGLDESVTIPETSSECEQETPPKSVATTPTPASTRSRSTDSSGPDIQVGSINISAKINIKIHVPAMSMSSTESEPEQEQEPEQECNEPETSPQARQSVASSTVDNVQPCLGQSAVGNGSILGGDGNASEDEHFLSQAEKLLNQLYGQAWQTPEVISSLKRSSGGERRTPLGESRRQPRARAAATTARKRVPAAKEESLLGDFNLFKRAVHATKLNSTQLPKAQSRHMHDARWRQLVDTDSGSDASDDEDADATESDSSSPRAEDAAHITYLDLSSREVQVVCSPEDAAQPARRLDDILRKCRATPKAKLPAPPATRRQLFTPNVGYEDPEAAKRIVDEAVELDMLDNLENVHLPGTPVHKRLQQIKRQLGLLPAETPKARLIFKTPTVTPMPTATPTPAASSRKPASRQTGKCSFLKSLEPQIERAACNNEAYHYRENFAKTKEQLAQHLYGLFNASVFNNELDVPITWSKLLRNTAGRCKNKRRLQQRSSLVELSVKVLTSADRLRCTLIHELCHAAAWIFNGESGHGRVWKMWANRANAKFPDLPPITVCHSYSIEFKYTYKCLDCNTSSHAHSKSKKVEHMRCRRCHGPITVLLNKKDKAGNVVQTPVREATGFAKFVKENFQKYKRDNLTAAEVMRILGVEYSNQKNQAARGVVAQASKTLETLTLSDDD